MHPKWQNSSPFVSELQTKALQKPNAHQAFLGLSQNVFHRRPRAAGLINPALKARLSERSFLHTQHGIFPHNPQDRG